MSVKLWDKIEFNWQYIFEFFQLSLVSKWGYDCLSYNYIKTTQNYGRKWFFKAGNQKEQQTKCTVLRNFSVYKNAHWFGTVLLSDQAKISQASSTSAVLLNFKSPMNGLYAAAGLWGDLLVWGESLQTIVLVLNIEEGYGSRRSPTAVLCLALV